MSDTNPPDKTTSWRDAFHDELRALAARALAPETHGRCLQPNLLVRDAYQRLIEQKRVDATNRPRVLAAGASVVRQLMVDCARRGREQPRIGPGDADMPLCVLLAGNAHPIDVIALNNALEELGRENPRAEQVAEMRLFGGLSPAEIADRLNVAHHTVELDWRFARAWLYRLFGPHCHQATHRRG